MPGKLNLCGQKFYRLTALNYAGRKNGRRQWRFRCKCGNEIEVYGSSIKNGNTKSCGCLQKDSLKLIHKNNIKDGTSPRRLLCSYKKGCYKTGVVFQTFRCYLSPTHPKNLFLLW